MYLKDCLEMLMKKATSTILQEEMSELFPFTGSANVADDGDYQQANLTSLDLGNEIPTGEFVNYLNITIYAI